MLVTSALRRRFVCCNRFVIDEVVQWESCTCKSDLTFLKKYTHRYLVRKIFLHSEEFAFRMRHNKRNTHNPNMKIKTKHIFVFLIFQCFCIFQIFSWNKTLVEFNSEEIDSIYFKNKLREKFRTKNSKQAFLYKNFQNPNQYKHLLKNENQKSFLFSSVIVRVNCYTWSNGVGEIKFAWFRSVPNDH